MRGDGMRGYGAVPKEVDGPGGGCGRTSDRWPHPDIIGHGQAIPSHPALL